MDIISEEELNPNFAAERLLDEEKLNFEIKGRKPIYVFLRSMKNAKNLTKYGELAYTSSKGNYACIYVYDENFEKQLQAVKRLPFVKFVKRGRISELAEDFGLAFQETSREVNAELKAQNIYL